jgi:hypothetical protein
MWPEKAMLIIGIFGDTQAFLCDLNISGDEKPVERLYC